MASGSAPRATPSTRDTHLAISVAELVREYLAEEFGTPGAQAPWYDNILGVAVRFNTVTIRTDLSAAPRDRATAEAICRAVSRFPDTSRGRGLGSLAVRVYGRGDHLLATHRDGAARGSAGRRRPAGP